MFRDLRPRKRGRRSGVRLRARRRKYRLPLPSIVFRNAQSIRNKTDELEASVKANLMCLSQTWLTENDGDPEIPGFTVVRGDRSLDETGKRRGGGVCVYVNRHWCCNITVKAQLCTEHLELLTVALRPYYLLREFNQLLITALYIHPAADVKLASEGVGRVIHRLSSLSPDSPCFVLVDFNKCRLNRVLPHFEQYVTCLDHLQGQDHRPLLRKHPWRIHIPTTLRTRQVRS